MGEVDNPEFGVAVPKEGAREVEDSGPIPWDGRRERGVGEWAGEFVAF